MTNPETSPTCRLIAINRQYDLSVLCLDGLEPMDKKRAAMTLEEGFTLREALAGLYEAVENAPHCRVLACLGNYHSCAMERWKTDALKACDDLCGKLLGDSHERP